MNIAVCEDLEDDSARLCVLLKGYLKTGGLVAAIDVFTSGEDLLKAFSPGKYQIIFQDIYLDKNGISGMKVAEKIRERDSEVSIIFTTTSVEHGPTSYEVKADYYIVKPVDKERLGKALDRCRAQLDRYARTIEVSTNWQVMKIRLRDIYYAEVMKNNVILHTMSGAVVTRMSFGELLHKLEGSSFATCHRSYVVNLIHVADMRDNSFILKNGSQVAISRTYTESAKQAFREFFWES